MGRMALAVGVMLAAAWALAPAMARAAASAQARSFALPQEVLPGAPARQATGSAKASGGRGTDAGEAELWRLYRAGKLELLEARLRRYRATHRGKSLNELEHWLAVARVNRVRERARKQGDWFAVVEDAGLHLRDFGCRFPKHEALLAHAWARLGYAGRAERHYRKLFTRCAASGAPDDALVAALDAAMRDLPYARAGALAQAMRQAGSPLANLAEFRHLAQGIRRARDAGAARALEARARALLLDGQWSPGPKDVLAMGMALREKGLKPEAARWFHRYLDEGGAGKTPAGVFTARWALGHRVRATLLLPPQSSLTLSDEEALQAAMSRELFASYKARDDAGVVRLARALSARRKLATSERLILGWSLNRMGKRREAHRVFAKLYAETKDARALKGARITRADVVSDRAAWFYGRKQFLAARAQGGRASLKNLDYPSLAAGLSWRSRAGAHPLERMDVLELPVLQGRMTLGGVHDLSLTGALVRVRAPAHRAAVPYERNAAAGSPVSGVSVSDMQWSLAYMRSGVWKPHARLTLPPRGPGMPRALAWEAGLAAVSADWHGDATIYHAPLKANALSYVGRLDGLGQPWGQVMRSGLRVSGWRDMPGRWSLNAEGLAERLRGRQVLANTHLAARAGLARDVDGWPADFMSVGPFLAYEHYAHNALPFTIGHGGYFSPQQSFSLGLGWDYLSPEAARWVLRGHADAAWQWSKSDDVRLFPLSADPTLFRGGVANGLSYNLELLLARLLTPRWFAHGGLIVRGSPPNYRDVGLMLGLEWHFGERAAVFSRDLRRRFLEDAYQ